MPSTPSTDDVTAPGVPGYSDAYEAVFCGTDWLGLSSSSLALGVAMTDNLDAFPDLADNLLQAGLNALVLGNLMESPMGFVTSSAFQNSAHHPLSGEGRASSTTETQASAHRGLHLASWAAVIPCLLASRTP